MVGLPCLDLLRSDRRDQDCCLGEVGADDNFVGARATLTQIKVGEVLNGERRACRSLLSEVPLI